MALKTVSLDLYQNGEKKVRVPLWCRVGIVKW